MTDSRFGRVIISNPGGDRIESGLYLQDGSTYGVAMPVVIDFDTPIPDNAKAAVEKRLFVQSNPPQVGVWHWFGDNHVEYRPQNYWKTGTKITVRAALGSRMVEERLRGGIIEAARSAAMGGALFRLRLPLEAAEAPVANAPEAPHA